MHHELWNEITYSVPTVNGAVVEVWELINDFTHTSLDILLRSQSGIRVNLC